MPDMDDARRALTRVRDVLTQGRPGVPPTDDAVIDTATGDGPLVPPDALDAYSLDFLTERPRTGAPDSEPANHRSSRGLLPQRTWTNLAAADVGTDVQLDFPARSVVINNRDTRYLYVPDYDCYINPQTQLAVVPLRGSKRGRASWAAPLGYAQPATNGAGASLLWCEDEQSASAGLSLADLGAAANPMQVLPGAPQAANVLAGSANANAATIITVPAGRTWQGWVTLSATITVAPGGAAAGGQATVTVQSAGASAPASGVAVAGADIHAPAANAASSGTWDSGEAALRVTIVAPAGNTATLQLNLPAGATGIATAAGTLA